mmetsp:Transcript_116711/g.330149  ORF Transcript_116711/g.330149 Transcript_116711/m.330149 type:complete len:702 (+) Transcript_116711:174-2279(+)|eukprot:CAMPEP_0117526484 /NCGR_PEP_ID=MMETSP0784-20121206/36309_1 /TAXON_ID=39447 /ORGANISM="" /LENGTH=701 /DNA_ID=CAMNT_0005322713 /DNA_START=122 /DNA_END=2227 /DNA_ORIENTATION=-
MAAVGTEESAEVVSYLCKKFSGLMDRVQAAEARQNTAQWRSAALASHLRQAEERSLAARTGLESNANLQRSEVEEVRKRLSEAQADATKATEKLRCAREEAASLEKQCESLSAQCLLEQQCVRDALDQAAQSDDAWAASERDRALLREEASDLTARLAELQEELAAGHERESHRRADLRVMEDRLNDARQQRKAAVQKSETRHEEICGAVRKATLFRERLDAAQHALRRREQELEVEDGQLAELLAENQQKEQEVVMVERSLVRLHDTQVALELALREHLETHERFKAVSKAWSDCQEAAEELERRRTASQSELASRRERLASLETELGGTFQRLQVLRDSVRQSKTRRERLEQEKRGVDCAEVSLKTELKRIFEDTERLRSERDEAAEQGEQVVRRLRAAEPALETARRRVRDLEQALEDVDRDAVRAKQRKETLMREVGQCREKLRVMRRKHDKVAEKSHQLETRLLRSSGSFGGTAGFAAAAASAGGGRGRDTCQTRRHSRVRGDAEAEAITWTPRAGALQNGAAVQRAAPDSRAASPCGGFAAVRKAPASSCRESPAAENSSGRDLGYLKHWVELEEARLGVARPPPTPSPAPNLERLDALPWASNARSPSPAQRSAAALAALAAGMDAIEAVALLNGGDALPGSRDDASGSAAFPTAADVAVATHRLPLQAAGVAPSDGALAETLASGVGSSGWVG